MKIMKNDMPFLYEYFNSLNSDNLYLALKKHNLQNYILELDNDRCVFSKDIFNIVSKDSLNKIMNPAQWYIAKESLNYIGYRPRAIKLNKSIYDYKFYHFSPITNEESILKNGIRIKSKNSLEEYENSIYLFSEYLFNESDLCNSLQTELQNIINQLREKSNNIGIFYDVFENN